jgi:fibronectin type 3 domain-containing protein
MGDAGNTSAKRVPYRWAALAVLTVFACGVTLATAQDGISESEYHRSFPPEPLAVRAEIRDGKPTVTWQKPPVPPGKLAYDPVIDHYRVYRMGREPDKTLIGETRATSFVDPNAPAGTTQRYVVTTVQRSGRESAPSQEAELKIPK